MNNIQKLMLGTANLNQMRAEIKAVVSTVASMLPVPPQMKITQDKLVYWSIEGTSVTKICCYETEELLDNDRLLYSTHVHELSLHDVVKVHRTLEEFLNFALECFPQLKLQMAAIFSAAEL